MFETLPSRVWSRHFSAQPKTQKHSNENDRSLTRNLTGRVRRLRRSFSSKWTSLLEVRYVFLAICLGWIDSR